MDVWAALGTIEVPIVVRHCEILQAEVTATKEYWELTCSAVFAQCMFNVFCLSVRQNNLDCGSPMGKVRLVYMKTPGQVVLWRLLQERMPRTQASRGNIAYLGD